MNLFQNLMAQNGVKRQRGEEVSGLFRGSRDMRDVCGLRGMRDHSFVMVCFLVCQSGVWLFAGVISFFLHRVV
jgi:hypothetical protein